jgi:hypothetical protein
MKFAKHERHGIYFLSTVAILLVLVSIGCLQNNKSKIIGSWKSQSMNNIDGNVQYTLFKFYKEGNVSRKTVITINDQSSKQKDKMIGKYKFKDDKINILITWDDGSTEIMSVGFPQKNKMLLGKYEMEKIE